ncbi:hypothetical protein I0E85_18875, partial [Klebsiella quasipneumoniae]|nr:hypothetical protein [Klebsiella quasipneumoniae]MBF7778844.1 hypothetical protein [Klebsiella quasipneumoniae]
FIVGGPVGDFELLLCHGTVCVVGKMRDLILQLSKSSIYSTKPVDRCKTTFEKGKVNDSVRKFLIPANQAVTDVLMEKMALFK